MATCMTCQQKLPERTPPAGSSLNCEECWEFRVRAGRINARLPKEGPCALCASPAHWTEGGWWRCDGGHHYQPGKVVA